MVCSILCGGRGAWLLSAGVTRSRAARSILRWPPQDPAVVLLRTVVLVELVKDVVVLLAGIVVLLTDAGCAVRSPNTSVP